MLEAALLSASLPPSPPLDEPTAEEYWRGLAIAKASEAAAAASLDRLMKEATAPRSEWPFVNGPVAVQAQRAAAVGAPAPILPAPVPQPVPRAAPLPVVMPKAAAPGRYVSNEEVERQRREYFQRRDDEDALRPRVLGQCSPTLRKRLAAQGQTPLEPEPGSYYLPPSVRHQVPLSDAADAEGPTRLDRPHLYHGASPSLRRLLKSRGQEPLEPPAGSYWLPPGR
jgi:hypothetical protein